MNIEDYFSLEKTYPEPSKIFSFPYKSLSEVSGDCIFVLDTNILLVPFDVSEKNFEVIVDVLKKLKIKNRLYIPARVAREFASNRGKKISQIFLKLRQKQQKLNTGYFSSDKYPILEHSDAFKELQKLNEKIRKDIKKARSLFKDVENEILNWNWNDPISLIYRQLFTQDIIIELNEKNSEIIADLNFRIKNSIAPGYKDEKKEDKGIGDLIIWKTIAQIGHDLKKNVVFVSNDKKGDWYYRQDNEGIYPKYELFDEFRTLTNGKSINIIDFPKFLEIFEIDKKIIADVKDSIDEIKEKTIESKQNSLLEELRKTHPELSIGVIVKHERFGYGSVIGIYGSDPQNAVLAINFDSHGEKRIMLKFAKLDFLF